MKTLPTIASAMAFPCGPDQDGPGRIG
jgi:hypothetical protein